MTTTTVVDLLGKEIEVEAGDYVVVPGEGHDTDWGQVSRRDGEWIVVWVGGGNRTPLPTSGVEGVYTSRAAAEAAYDAHVAALSEEA